MENDFEIENFDELEAAFEEFDDFDEIQDFQVETRTAILSKNNLIALLCLKTADQGGAICRIDPREDRPSVQIYDEAAQAVEWYSQSLITSRQNGWKVVYDGLPLQG